jgi:hypothetical protein
MTPTAAAPTPSARPTLRPLPTLAVEPTAAPAPVIVVANCPNPLARLTAPGQNQTISGSIAVMGAANLPNMQYYKVEFRPAGTSAAFSYITGQPRSADGVLGVWNTAAVPDGTYTVRLVVVDETGNYPPPCEVTVTVTR